MNRQSPAARKAVRSYDRHEPRTETTLMNASNATVAELATAGGSLAGDSPPSAPVGMRPRRIRHLGMAPSVHPEAYVAPTAVLSGRVSAGAGSCIMHGAVLAAEGGPVQVGAGCVILENAVLRGTVRHRLVIGDRVLAGPHAQLTGCTIADEVFIAASAMVLNGAHLGRTASGAVGAVVHLGAIVAPQARIPVGWVGRPVTLPASTRPARPRRSRQYWPRPGGASCRSSSVSTTPAAAASSCAPPSSAIPRPWPAPPPGPDGLERASL